MVESLPARFKSTRGWLVAAVVATGATAWMAVAFASDTAVGLAWQLGVVGLSVTLGSAEVAYLAWHNWMHGERGIALAVTAGASLGSLLMVGAAVGGVTARDLIGCAAGVGLLGMATAVGLFGIYRATGKSSAATLTGMFILLGLVYFSSVLWGAVPR